VRILDCALADWLPGFGDPTPAGWVTVAAYVLAAVLAFGTARRTGPGRPAERAFWIGAGLCLGFLAANKQLDLQSLLTAAGRCAAKLQGWYAVRREVQLDFVLALAAASVAAGGLALWLLRGTLRRTGLALAGLVWVGGFVLVRAVGFHHVDELIGLRVAEMRLNWALELGGIALFTMGAVAARRAARGR
jgi:hypothetical protein